VAYNGNVSDVLTQIVTVAFESLIDTTGLSDKSSQAGKAGRFASSRAQQT
jgi:hypothetical protein